MPKLKILSGETVIKILQGFGFQINYSKGSHFRLIRTLTNGSRQAITVPNHKEIAKGTLKSIYRQASAYIPTEELKKCFYGE